MGFGESVVSEVFGGEVRCVLQRQGVKESATVEPFFSLQLDIQVSLSLPSFVWHLQATGFLCEIVHVLLHPFPHI